MTEIDSILGPPFWQCYYHIIQIGRFYIEILIVNWVTLKVYTQPGWLKDFLVLFLLQQLQWSWDFLGCHWHYFGHAVHSQLSTISKHKKDMGFLVLHLIILKTSQEKKSTLFLFKSCTQKVLGNSLVNIINGKSSSDTRNWMLIVKIEPKN